MPAASTARLLLGAGRPSGGCQQLLLSLHPRRRQRQAQDGRASRGRRGEQRVRHLRAARPGHQGARRGRSLVGGLGDPPWGTQHGQQSASPRSTAPPRPARAHLLLADPAICQALAEIVGAKLLQEARHLVLLDQGYGAPAPAGTCAMHATVRGWRGCQGGRRRCVDAGAAARGQATMLHGRWRCEVAGTAVHQSPTRCPRGGGAVTCQPRAQCARLLGHAHELVQLRAAAVVQVPAHTSQPRCAGSCRCTGPCTHQPTQACRQLQVYRSLRTAANPGMQAAAWPDLRGDCCGAHLQLAWLASMSAPSSASFWAGALSLSHTALNACTLQPAASRRRAV